MLFVLNQQMYTLQNTHIFNALVVVYTGPLNINYLNSTWENQTLEINSDSWTKVFTCNHVIYLWYMQLFTIK